MLKGIDAEIEKIEYITYPDNHQNNVRYPYFAIIKKPNLTNNVIIVMILNLVFSSIPFFLQTTANVFVKFRSHKPVMQCL